MRGRVQNLQPNMEKACGREKTTQVEIDRAGRALPGSMNG
jgi:hypothetical protein